MRNLLPAILLAIALSLSASTSHGYGLCDLFGCPDDHRGSGCGCGCGCEAGCACEPGCGCGSACCADGRKFAGQKYNCECNSRVPWCPCTGPECCNSCECGSPCCGESCGEPACGCDPGCGCEPSCGCGSGCQSCPPKRHQCCLKHVGFCAPYYVIVNTLSNCCCSGCGCDEEVYWSEWHNDPPRCCDPCDSRGNWIGPSAGYRAPYDHAYAPQSYGGDEVYAQGGSAAVRRNVARQQTQRQPRGQVARTRKSAATNTYQW